MEWIAHCTVCGELDRAPNGSMMESAARIHRRDTGHTTIIGYEPSIIMGDKMVEVDVGASYKYMVWNWDTGEVYKSVSGYPTPDAAMGGAKTFIETELEDVVILAPTKGFQVKVISGETAEVPGYEEWYKPGWLLRRLEHTAPKRPFPQSYEDWARLAEDIKAWHTNDLIMASKVNFQLACIREDRVDPTAAEESKRWLMAEAERVGIT